MRPERTKSHLASCLRSVKFKSVVGTMRNSLVLIVLVGAVAVALATPVTKFTTKWDNLPLDQILSSDRLLQNYFDCLMDKGSCTADATELKKAIGPALKEECAGCSVKQKEGAEKVIKFLSEKKPNEWKKLEEKYDPTGLYRSKHKDLAKKHNVSI